MTPPDDATATLVAELRADGVRDLTLVRRLAGGFQTGAYLALDHGLPVVLKWTAQPDWAEVVVAAAPVVAAARAAGWPTTGWLTSGRTRDGGAYHLQEHAAGEPVELITHVWLDAVLPMVERQRDLRPASTRSWSAHDHERVFADPSGATAAVAGSGLAGKELVAAIARLCRPYGAVRLPDDDLVHGDLNPDNVLLLDGKVTAFVDVEAIGRGSRLHDLATIVVYATLWPGEAGTVDRVLAHSRAIAAGGQLEISVASVLIGLLEFGVHHWPTDDLASVCRTAADLVDGLRTGTPKRHRHVTR